MITVNIKGHGPVQAAEGTSLGALVKEAAPKGSAIIAAKLNDVPCDLSMKAADGTEVEDGAWRSRGGEAAAQATRGVQWRY